MKQKEMTVGWGCLQFQTNSNDWGLIYIFASNNLHISAKVKLLKLYIGIKNNLIVNRTPTSRDIVDWKQRSKTVFRRSFSNTDPSFSIFSAQKIGFWKPFLLDDCNHTSYLRRLSCGWAIEVAQVSSIIPTTKAISTPVSWLMRMPPFWHVSIKLYWIQRHCSDQSRGELSPLTGRSVLTRTFELSKDHSKHPD